MKIILVNRYLHPDQSATSRMTSSLAAGLRERGFPVAGLASRDIHNDRGQRLPSEGDLDGIRIHRLWTSTFGRSTLWGRALDYLTFHLSAAWWVLRHAERGDICIVCTDPPLLSVTLALPLRLRGARMVNWLHDLFPEVALRLGMPGSARLGRLALRLRDWSLARAAVNVTPTGTMGRFLAARGIPPDRLQVVHHWADAGGIRPVPPAANTLRRQWGLEGKFVVGYSGNFGRAHEFDTILEAADRLRSRDDIRFLFIGDGHKRAAVESWVREKQLDNVQFQPLQPSERLSESLCAADVHLVSLLPPLEPCIIPSKFYGILAAGRPTLFIGDLAGEVPAALTTGQCGRFVAIGDSAGLAAHIGELAAAPEASARMGENARDLFEREYTHLRGWDEWGRLIAGLIRTPESAVFEADRPQLAKKKLS
ncbi:glycosyltransferase family 4 protein [Inquilinus sp. OTU3971]|uniref:glycosyltransferase family 4 protein n=1 Tax=Inquilinus sp. OTU3971 TaxID=3043855 RepID=UPI00313B900C